MRWVRSAALWCAAEAGSIFIFNARVAPLARPPPRQDEYEIAKDLKLSAAQVFAALTPLMTQDRIERIDEVGAAWQAQGAGCRQCRHAGASAVAEPSHQPAAGPRRTGLCSAALY